MGELFVKLILTKIQEHTEEKNLLMQVNAAFERITFQCVILADQVT
jgi:hypothetical protein